MSLLYKNISDRIYQMVQEGAFSHGKRLPSIRDLSLQFQVSIGTVVQAYADLERRGIIQSRPQSGFYLSEDFQLIPQERLLSNLNKSKYQTAPQKVKLSELLQTVTLSARDSKTIPLGAANPSVDLLPAISLNRVMNKCLRQSKELSIHYDYPPGDFRLRKELSYRSTQWGCSILPSDFIITFGAMESITLALRAITKPGDVVAVESPCYFGILHAMESLGLRALEVPSDPQFGVQVDLLRENLKRYKLKAILLTPNFNNPLGSLIPDDHKKELARLSRQYEIPIIENDVMGDLYFGKNRPRTIKSYDKDGLVVLVSSFSKTLAPGYRVGWTSPGRYYDPIVQLKFTSSGGTATLNQFAVFEYMKTGAYDRHLTRFRPLLKSNLDEFTRAVIRHFPTGSKVSTPEGGYLLWVELPKQINSLDLHQKALQERISIVPGSLFSVTEHYRNYIRLNCANPWTPKIESAIKTLGNITASSLTE
jgi:DNA-binding transcriptional MocR family regulator